MTKENKLTCFYDGECPVCQIEINAMKKLDQKSKVNFIDISSNTKELEKQGISYQQAMDQMHIIDTEQGIQKGVAGFLLLWKQLPYYRRLVPIVQHTPGLKKLLEWGYQIFAKHRHKLKRHPQ